MTQTKPLTKRQVEVVQLLSDGNTTHKVADRLSCAPSTVRKHIEQAKERMGAKTIAHMVKLSMQQGFI